MKEVGFKQAMQGLTAMAVSADWNVIDADAFQEAFVADPVESGRLFTEYLRRRGQMQVVQYVVASAAQLPVWETAMLGKSAEQWVVDLEIVGKPATEWASDIMRKSKFTIAPAGSAIELIRAEVRHLGFSDPKDLPTWQAILTRARTLGFATDIPEAGPAARLVAGPDDSFWVASMEPITDSEGRPYVFYVDRSDRGPVLGAHYVGPEDRFDLERGLVLARRKVLASALPVA